MNYGKKKAAKKQKKINLKTDSGILTQDLSRRKWTNAIN